MALSRQSPGHVSRYFDRIAIALSAICIVHCIAVPLVLTALPIAAVWLGPERHFHAAMLWLVLPTSVGGFALGYRVHRRFGIVALGAVGVAALTVAALWGHDQWPPAAESAVSIAGSVVLAAAHWLNFRDVRRLHHHTRRA